ncbi:MAG: hypothetical protein Q7R80_03505 [bacterium]|nr:hypothetical protein [bacterium]
MPTLQELFRDRAALDLALHEIVSVCPMELRLAMVADPHGPREIAAFQRARDRFLEIGNLPAILFRAGLAAGVIAQELHTLLEEGGNNAELRFTDDSAVVVAGSRGPVIRPVAAIARVLADALVISEVNADTLWRSFVHLMRDHYRRPTFFRLRVERNGTIRLLRPADAATQPSNA